MSIVLSLGHTVQHLHFIGECPEAAHCNFWHKTLGLLSDGPHLIGELVIDLAENVVLWAIAFTIGAKWNHRRFDREHGIQHNDGSID